MKEHRPTAMLHRAELFQLPRAALSLGYGTLNSEHIAREVKKLRRVGSSFQIVIYVKTEIDCSADFSRRLKCQSTVFDGGPICF